MTREKVLNKILDKIDSKDLVICSLGKMSRELFELRKKRGEPNDDFLVMGSMGASVGIGLGVALNTKKKVYVLTGDGALLMKLGSLATVLKYKPKNLEIIVLNNYAHDSTGGQPTAFKEVEDFVKKHCRIINVEKGARKNLGRPDISCKEIRDNFMRKVRE